jgi:hypothetical protein
MTSYCFHIGQMSHNSCVTCFLESSVILYITVWNKTKFNHVLYRAIAQAIIHWLLTAGARVRARVWSSGICGGQSGAGAGFLRVLRSPLPIFIPPILHHHNHPGRYSRPNSGRRAEWTQLDSTPYYANNKKVMKVYITHKDLIVI